MNINDALSNARGETIEERLREVSDFLDQEERFTSELLEFVDMSVMFSPVIAI